MQTLLNQLQGAIQFHLNQPGLSVDEIHLNEAAYKQLSDEVHAATGVQVAPPMKVMGVLLSRFDFMGIPVIREEFGPKSEAKYSLKMTRNY